MALILIADDRPANRDVLTTLLGYAGHRVLEAADGQEALARARAERPDLVIADILMPTMDGYEFVQRLRAEPDIAATPVIFYTATYLSREAEALARACGVAYVLFKPVEPQVVLETVHAALGQPAAALALTPAAPAEFERQHVRLVSDTLARNAEALEISNRRLALLVDLGVELAAERDPHRLLVRSLHAARQLIGAHFAAAAILDDDGQALRAFVTTGLDVETAGHLEAPLVDRGVAAAVLATRRPVRCPPQPLADGRASFPASHAPFRSFLGVPVATAAQIYGLLYLTDKLGLAEFVEDDERLAKLLAAQLAVAYENAYLYAEVQHQAEALREEAAQRRRAAVALAAREQRFRALIEKSSDAITLLNADGRVEYVSASAERILGYTSEEMLGRDPLRLIHADDRPAVLSRLADLTPTPGAAFTAQYRLRHRDGTWRWIETTVTNLLQDPNVQALVFNYHDITERRTAETALAQRERRFAALIANIADAIILVDPAGRIVYASPSTARLSGYSEPELLGQNALALVHPEDADRLQQLLLGLAGRNGSGLPAQFRVRHPDGSWRWAEAIGTNALHEPGVEAIVVNYRDITERKQHHDELEAIVQVSAALRAAPSRAEMPPVILEQLLRLLNADAAALVSLDTATGGALLELAGGQWAPLTGERLPAGQGVSGYVIATSQPFRSQDLGTELRLAPAERLGDLRAGVCVPLIADRQTIGALWLARRGEITDADVRVLTAIGDITATALQRASLHEQTELRLRRLAALRAIDIAITSSFDMRLTLGVVLEHVQAELSVDAAALLKFDTRHYALVYLLGRGFRGDAVTRTQLRLGEGQAGQAAFDLRPSVVADLGALSPPFLRAELAAEEGFVGYACAPLVTRGQVKGVLEVFRRSPLRPEAEWQDFLEALAGQAAIAVDNAELLDGLQRKHLELMVAYDTTLEGWSRALDLRDQETEGHTQRVTDLTVRLARAFGLDEAEIVHLRRGALLHDIGKMGIPDAILRKPGPLTAEEWDVMRRHPAYAHELLAPIPYLRPALDIPYCHHEKWDGTGYPRGLRGDQIPLAARLFAVVDVWDALTSDRPYRPAWPQEQALAYIRAQAGTHFDSVAVTAFLQLVGDA